MKKLFLLLFLLSTNSLFAQDVIVKKDGSTILSKVIEIGQSEVKYKKHSNPEGPTYTIKISDLLSINYQNGEKEDFSNTSIANETINDAMRKQFTSSNDDNVTNSFVKEVETSSKSSTEVKTSSKLSPNEYSFYGLAYTADFDYVEEGIYGFSGQSFMASGFGIALSLGWNFKNKFYAFKLGPTYCVPITDKFFLFTPLYAVMNYYSKPEKFKFGAELTPSLGFKFGKFIIASGVSFGWVDGSDKIGTGFTANIAITL